MLSRAGNGRKHPVPLEGVPGKIGTQPLNAILKNLCTPSKGTIAHTIETTKSVNQLDRPDKERQDPVNEPLNAMRVPLERSG